MKIAKPFLIIACVLFTLISACKKKEVGIIETNPPPSTTEGTQWYVAANGLSTNSGLSPNSPKGNIREVAGLTKPGDFVNIMSTGGEFKRIGTSGSIISTTVSGEAGKFITFRGFPVGGTKPVIRGYSMFAAVSLSGRSYIKIENLEIIGDLNGQFGGPALNLSGANAVYDRVRPLWVASNSFTLTEAETAYQTMGILTQNNSHHIEIRNCKIHDLPGGAIGTNETDYITIEDNEVYNTASLSLYGMSGISYLRPYNFDTNTSDYKIIIRRNISYNNKSLAKTYTKTGTALTDGNGIICDVSADYNGKTLVENNVVYNNGGGGINLVGAVNCDIFNNTSYNNGQELDYAEMTASFASKNIRFNNNIMFAKSGGKCVENTYTNNGNTALQNSNVVFNKNVMHNGSTTPSLNGGFTNTNFVTGNPQFRNTNLTSIDLRLDPAKTPMSSAANFGTNVTGQFSIKDILGVTRGTAPDCGAYESF
ncbi:hypothetical protein A5893_12945 [Pedobacter psychrophilus]|uniref:Right handed beta helix domain-containing protein n=1 Tax=Pedobacter psychrophilus TaxID=1826909 RepID=A0A179DEL6_9SPHI|nr:right-handed parallel beta-helix repeat-containing protein [Pedobacter psychrophilus]OAQ38939.1 hypothetical protein A5893_12945 [Pedobacter psychrophilus]